MACNLITLYVKSEKVVTGETSVRESHLVKRGIARGDSYRMRDMFWDTAFDTRVEELHDYVLPDDQKAVVETVKRFCERHSIEVRVVDVTKENLLHRAVQEEANKIKTFPTLITDSGGRVEGSFSEEQLEALLAGD